MDQWKMYVGEAEVQYGSRGSGDEIEIGMEVRRGKGDLPAICQRIG